MKDISKLRSEYSKFQIKESHLPECPIRLFESWFEDALKLNIQEPNAMALSTVDTQNKPSSRIVLLKGFSKRGFTFFTHYKSRKGRELASNPHASLLFFWKELERQIRVEGSIKKVSAEENDAYFYSRPLGSQLGAIVSHQSEIISNRSELESKMESLKEKYQDSKPKRPEHWGGYVLSPENVEFWQGRPNRLHDRFLYKKEKNIWKIMRLSP